MTKLSKKKIKEIERISIFTDIIKQFSSTGDIIAKAHWVDLPPDMWYGEMTREYDMMVELEMKLKNRILEIINK